MTVPSPTTNTPSFLITADDLEGKRITPEVLNEARAKLSAFAQIKLENGGVHAACVKLAAANEGKRGWSWKRLETQLAEYLRTGDWTVCLDRAKAGKAWWGVSLNAAPALPGRFIDYWKGLQMANQADKARSEWKALKRRWHCWRAGDTSKAIPGYDTPPPANPATDLPYGWDYSNLMRYRATKHQRTAFQQGRTAAADYRPFLLQTRVGLEVGQYYLWDDMWNNLKVIAPNKREPARLLQFHALDLASACSIARGYKPALKDEETEVKEGLKHREMIQFTCHVFTTIGYRKEGSTQIVEAGTATIREEEAKWYYDLTGGKIKVERGVTSKDPMFAGIFEGASKGNPRFKTWLETFGGLIQNASSNILEFPGQTGSNSRLDKPEESVGMEAYAKLMYDAKQTLPKEIQAKISLGFLPLNEAIFALESVTQFVNDRHDHELEGWRAAKNFEQVWRMDETMPWQSWERLLDMPEDKRAATLAYVMSQKNLIWERRMSPLAVLRRGQAGFAKLPAHAGAVVLRGIPWREVSVRKNMIELMVPEVDPDEPLHYEPILSDGNGAAVRLQQDSKWNARVNPFNPEVIFVYDAKDAYLGLCPRWNRVCRTDVEAMKRAYGRVHHAEAELAAEAARLGAKIIQKRIEDAETNARILGGVDPERRKAIALADAADEADYRP